MPSDHLLSILSCSSELKWLDLSNCQLRAKAIKQIINVLKQMKHLQRLNLSNNIMTNNTINELAPMINNNQDIQVLSLPNCVLFQKDLRIIIQAMQTVSSLEYVDFNYNTVDDELASDVALLFTKNGKLKELRFTKVTLNQTGFQHLNNYLVKIKGLTTINIIGCSFIGQKAVKLLTAINNNSEIQELNLSNCIMSANQSWSMLSSISKLKYLNLSNCLLQPNETKEIFGILKWMKCLQHVDLSANNMDSDAINDLAVMIKNNKQFQSLSLPNHFLDQGDLRIIIQALQTISSLQYVDFSMSNEVDNELASDVSTLFANNSELEQLNFGRLILKHSGFQNLKSYLVRLKGLKHLSITNCIFDNHDVALLEGSVIYNGCNIQELTISNCTIIEQNALTNIRDHVGVFNQLEILELSNSSIIDVFVCHLSSFLSCSSKLKQVILCNCKLLPDALKQIVMVLKYMRHLECVDFSGNIMMDDLVRDIEAMIINNKQLQKLCLPHCVVLSRISLRTIIQAMQTVSSLQYVDFNGSKLDDNLASDVAILLANNSELKTLKFSQLILNHNSLQLLKSHIEKVGGLKLLSISSCHFSREDAVKLKTTSHNSEIQHLSLSNCSILHVVLSIISFNINLRSLNLSNCNFFTISMIKILDVLKHMKHLQYINLSANAMTDAYDDTNEITAMIANNKYLQTLYLPTCILKEANLRIMFHTMQTVSFLKYVDFSTNKINNELAIDIALLFANNNRLEVRFSGFTMDQSGFHHVKNYLVKITGLKSFSITDCKFTKLDAVKIMTVIRNSEIEVLNLSNCNMPSDHLLSILSCSSELKWLDLSNCQLRAKAIKQIINVLKQMKHLQRLNLSNNIMTNNTINELAPMINNNQSIQVLSLPNCVLFQKDLRIIIQAMQTVSSLEYVDFNYNTVDDELASDIALLFTKNSKLKELRFTKVTLNQTGFQHLNNYLVKIKGLTTINIIGCSLITVKLLTAINNNSEIQELNLSNCMMSANQSWSMLSCIPKLKYLNLSQCLLQPNKTKEIFGILKRMKCLQHVDLSANNMNSDAVSDVAAMIKNNEHIEVLSLPNGVLSQEDLRIIVQAMQTVSSLHYVDFNANKIDNGLSTDVAILIDNNTNFEQLIFAKFELDQDGFNNLKSHLNVFRGVKYFKIVGCTFTEQDIANLATAVNNNPGIEELDLSYSKAFCKTEMLCIFLKLKTLLYLRCLKFNNITITNQMEHEIITVIHNNSNLEHLEMTGCYLSDIFIITIKNRKNLLFK